MLLRCLISPTCLRDPCIKGNPRRHGTELIGASRGTLCLLVNEQRQALCSAARGGGGSLSCPSLLKAEHRRPISSITSLAYSWRWRRSRLVNSRNPNSNFHRYRWEFLRSFQANDAYMCDFDLFVPSDCTVSNTKKEHDSALGLMRKFLKADTRSSLGFVLHRRQKKKRNRYSHSRK